jgi:hypothetical protein
LIPEAIALSILSYLDQPALPISAKLPKRLRYSFKAPAVQEGLGRTKTATKNTRNSTYELYSIRGKVK